MNKAFLGIALAAHELWLRGDERGNRFCAPRGIDLRDSALLDSDLRGIDLRDRDTVDSQVSGIADICQERTMRTLVLPLSTDSDGVIIDGNGHEIADLWAIDKAGKMRVTEESEAAMRERAAEIVLRCNLHDELVKALRDLLEQVETCDGTAQINVDKVDAVLAKLPEGR